MSVYSLPACPASACPLESFRSQIRAALKPSPNQTPITPPQAVLGVIDVLVERADGSAILEDMVDRISMTIAAWATDWGLADDAVADDLEAWLGNDSAISTTTVVIN